MVSLLERQLGMGARQVDVPTADPAASLRSAGMMARAKALARWVWNGTSPAEQYFGPGVPLTPVAPEEVAGRLRDYPMTANLQWRPRAEEFTPYQELYMLADTHDLTRLCIETRKDQISRQKWTIRLRKSPSGKKFGDEQQDLIEFFKSPDKRERWQQWLCRILEDMFVGDCATIYQRLALDGSVWGFEPIDGTTIVLRLDPWGRVPLEGEAYTQFIKGLPSVAYSREQLIYAPRRPRNQKGYGLSPVEQIIVTVNTALRRQMHQLAWYSDGSTPDLIVGVPDSWGDKEVGKLAAHWMAKFRGNSKERRGLPLILPGGNECKFENTKKDPLKDEFDEWLARVVCYCFSLPPTPFVRQMNRATAETAQEAALTEGLEPIKDWIKELVDDMLRRMRRADSEFAWVTEEAIDPLVRAQVHQIYLTTGVLDVNEVRDTIGLDPKKEAPAAATSALAAAPSTANGTETPKPSAGADSEKVIKAHKHTKVLPKRDREDLLRMEHKYTLGVMKEITKIRKSVVARLRSSEKMSKTDATELQNILASGDFDGLKKYIKEHSQDVYEGGVAAAGEALDATAEMLKLANEKAIEWAQKNAAEKITDIEQTTRSDIRDLVTEAMENGWSNDDLANKLEDSWAFSPERAEMIARTETAFADLKGNIELSKAAGVERVQWLASDGACDDCEELNGEDAPVDGEFKDGTPADEPAHPNCRCDRIAILPDQGEED